MEIVVFIEELPEIPSRDFYFKTASIWHNWIIKNLRQGKDFYGQPFQPLNPLTLLSRRKRKGIPLSDTGRLSQSIQLTPFSNGVIMRTNVIYARTHQYGAIIRPRRAKWLLIPINSIARYRGFVKGARFIRLKEVVIPSRPFFPLPYRDLPPELVKIWLKVI